MYPTVSEASKLKSETIRVIRPNESIFYAGVEMNFEFFSHIYY